MLTPPSPPGRRALQLLRRAAVPLWLAAIALVLAGTVWRIERVAENHLKTEAEQVALSWAHYLGAAVPEVDAIFAGQLPGAQAREELERLRTLSGVFRFKFFAPDGRLLLLSDSLTSRPEDAGQGGFSNPDAATAVLSGGSWIQLKRGDGVKRPPVFSEAYVPMRRGVRLIGMVEVYVDQTDRAAVVTRSFNTVAAIVVAALALLSVFGALLWRRLARREQAARERARFLASHDALTGALNRAAFESALEQAAARGRLGGPGVCVLHVDLDRFKDVNDTLGHAAGDELLRQAAARLRGVVRSVDTLARLGGDEFAVLQIGAEGSDAVAALARRIVDALATPYDLDGRRTAGGASVGAAIQGLDGDDAGSLMHHADLALFRAKSQGRAGYSFYDAGLDHALQNRRALTQDLRGALAQGSLALHFQPLYASDGRTLCGYEALARWPHPTRGFVPPAEFVPLAEQAGLIEDLGRWVLQRACAEAARWPAPLSVAVNLSPAQFRQEGRIVEEVAAALAASGLPASRLELEITESLLMGNTDAVLRMLDTLHAMGVRIAMDDFGTGYSSLAYLWRFPFDKVKIDRAFTQHLAEDSKVSLIVHSIVSLAHSLKMRVNAEGVETEAQRDALNAHGCDELQGFLLGRPAPPDRLPHAAEAAERHSTALT